MRFCDNLSEQEISMVKDNSSQKDSLFEQIGGLTKVKNLADEFYTVMERDSNARALRDVHPGELINSRKNLYRFISEWLGGPKLFGAQHVNAKWLELRHRHFNPTQEHEEQWLYCMDKAMTNLEFDNDLKLALNTKFSSMIKLMRTQRESIMSS